MIETLHRLNLLAHHFICRGVLLGVNLQIHPDPRPRTGVPVICFALLALSVLIAPPQLRVGLAFVLLSPIWLYAFSRIKHEVIENRAYISIVGIGALAAWAADRTPYLVAVLVILYAIRTVQRNRDWQSELRLWAAAIQETPMKGQVRLNYAAYLLEFGFIDLAEAEFMKIIDLGIPQAGVAMANIVGIRARQDRLREALEFLPKAVKRWPDCGLLRANYAGVLLHFGRPYEAHDEATEALRFFPSLDAAKNNLAESLHGIEVEKQVRKRLAKKKRPDLEKLLAFELAKTQDANFHLIEILRSLLPRG